MDRGEDDAGTVRGIGRVPGDLHDVEDGIREDAGVFPHHLDHIGELEIVQVCRVGVEVIEAF